MSTIHDFKTSLTFGKKAEVELDKIFSTWYQIEEVSLEDEKKLGIDRIFTRKDGTKVTVEYKADRWAINTSNIYIELEVSGKPGWTKKTVADIVVYAIVDKFNHIDSALILTQDYIKAMLPVWEQLPKKRIQNTNFYGIGVLVSIESLAEEVKILSFTN